MPRRCISRVKSDNNEAEYKVGRNSTSPHQHRGECAGTIQGDHHAGPGRTIGHLQVLDGSFAPFNP